MVLNATTYVIAGGMVVVVWVDVIVEIVVVFCDIEFIVVVCA